MKHNSFPPTAPAVTPKMALRFGAIIAGLVAVVARRFLREPRLVGLILPLCRWFARTAQRFARVTAAPAVVRALRAGAGAQRVRLPSQWAWLLRELQHEAVAYRGYLEQLLAEPGTREALEAAPALGRLLRPLCHMLGIEKTVVTAEQVVALWEPAAAIVAAPVGPSPELPTRDCAVRTGAPLIPSAPTFDRCPSSRALTWGRGDPGELHPIWIASPGSPRPRRGLAMTDDGPLSGAVALQRWCNSKWNWHPTG